MEIDLNLLLVQLAVIFLPGIIWERLDAQYAAKVKPAGLEVLLRSLLFGLVVYAVEFVLYSLLGWQFAYADFANAATKNVVTPAVVREIIWAMPISFSLALVWLYAARFKWLSRFLQKIGATKKFGDEDVWTTLSTPVRLMLNMFTFEISKMDVYMPVGSTPFRKLIGSAN